MGSKNKGKPKSPSSAIPATALGQWAKNQYYPLLQQAFHGQGLLPTGLQTLREQEAYRGLDDAYTTASRQLDARLGQYLAPQDVGPRRYLLDALNYQRQIAKDNLRRSLEHERVMDKYTAQNLGFTAWGNEMRMGIDAMQAWNAAEQQRLAQEAQYGTFGTNLAGGLGYGLTSLYFANKMATK